MNANADESVERLARFRCTECGDCCRRHRVPVTHRDLERLERATGEPAQVFVEWLSPDDIDMTGEPESFVELTAGRRLLVLSMRRDACRFLEESGKCRVYAARPASCRTFPLEVTFDERDRVIRLDVLQDAACEGAFDGERDTEGIAARHRTRTQELQEYVERVTTWNKQQRLRRLMGRSAESEAAFFRFIARSYTQP